MVNLIEGFMRVIIQLVAVLELLIVSHNILQQPLTTLVVRLFCQLVLNSFLIITVTLSTSCSPLFEVNYPKQLEHFELHNKLSHQTTPVYCDVSRKTLALAPRAFPDQECTWRDSNPQPWQCWSHNLLDS